MGMRYRKSIKLGPGVKLNLNAKSVSITGGVPGAHVTYNNKGQRTTSAGLPGSGISYRTTKNVRGARQSLPSADHSTPPPALALTKRKLVTASAVALVVLSPVLVIVGIVLYVCWASGAYIFAIPLTIVALVGVPYAALWILLYCLGVKLSSVMNAKN